MFRAERSHPDFHGAFIIRSGLGVAALAGAKDAHHVDGGGELGVVFAEVLGLDVQHALQQRLGLGVLLLVVAQGGQVEQALRHLRVLFSQHGLPNFQRLLLEQFRIRILRSLLQV